MTSRKVKQQNMETYSFSEQEREQMIYQDMQKDDERNYPELKNKLDSVNSNGS